MQKEREEDFIFNGMLLNPALTPLDGTHPGFSLFNFDENKEAIHGLEMYYLRLRRTYGLDEVPDIDNDKVKFVNINFAKEFGIKTLTEKSFLKFT